MMNSIHSENGKSLSYHIGPLLQTVGFDHRPNGIAKPFHFAFQSSSHSSFPKDLQRRISRSTILPEPKLLNYRLLFSKSYAFRISRVVFTVTGSNQSGEHGSPFIHRKVFGVRVSGPNAFKNDLVFGLIASTTGLDHSWFRQGPIIFTHGISQAPVIHVPNILSFHHHGFEINAPGASRGRRPINLRFRKKEVSIIEKQRQFAGGLNSPTL